MPGVADASLTLTAPVSSTVGPVRWSPREPDVMPWDRHMTSTKSLTSTWSRNECVYVVRVNCGGKKRGEKKMNEKNRGKRIDMAIVFK
jgi:hypothetical protein